MNAASSAAVVIRGDTVLVCAYIQYIPCYSKVIFRMNTLSGQYSAKLIN